MGRARVLAWGLGGLLGVTAASCAGLWGVGTQLPSDVNLETAAVLPASPEQIYPLIADPEGVQTWWESFSQSRAADGYPAMTVVPRGPAEPGSQVDFVASGSTLETWTLVELDPPRRVVWSVDFKMVVMERTLTLDPEPSGTRMTWAESGVIEHPLMRYFPLLMPPESTLDNFQMAMARLGELAAAVPSPPPPGASPSSDRPLALPVDFTDHED